MTATEVGEKIARFLMAAESLSRSSTFDPQAVEHVRGAARVLVDRYLDELPLTSPEMEP